jgi:hypothetical protein
MQATLQQLPEVGKTYVSQADPTFSIYVRRIDLIEAAGDDPAGFIAEGCDPKDKGNEDAPYCEIIDDEWRDFGFASVAAQTA